MKEITQGFARKIEPCVLCAYEVDCENVVDLTTQDGRESASVAVADIACAWFAELAAGREPASWLIADRLMARGCAGALVPSFAPGAGVEDVNLVLWTWGPDPPHRVHVHDPSGRLPRDQLSWPAES